MQNEDLKQLVGQGLAAMKAGSDVAARATAEISNSATHPALKAGLEEGNATAKTWAERIERALQQVGGGGQQQNPILEAHYQVSQKIRNEATSDDARDLGIVAAGQLALHYWIAAFGTMANYTKKLGLTEVAQDMKSSTDEAKQADDKQTAIAEQLLG